jgi:hypothetical protein
MREKIWSKSEWIIEEERRAVLERQLKDEGYSLSYLNEQYDVEVVVVFADDTQAAIFKLTYM